MHAHTHHTRTCTAPSTHSWHTRKGSSSGEEVRGKPSVCVSKAGGGKSDSPLSPTKTCFDASAAAATRLSLALFFTRTVCVRVFFFLCVCVRASQRSSEEARGGGRPQERAPQEN